jgi:hypothetical protein
LRGSRPFTLSLRAKAQNWLICAQLNADHESSAAKKNRRFVRARIPVDAWAGGLAAAVVIGALAGLLPAICAARLSPAQALWSV